MEFSCSPLEGYNAIFAGMIFISILYFAIATLSGIGADDGDASGAHDFDHGESLDASDDGSGDCGDSHDHDHDHDHDSENHGYGDILSGLLNTEKRCPLTFAIFIMLLVWGVGGYLLNIFILRQVPGFTVMVAAIFTHVTAGIIAVIITRRIAPIVARTIPTSKGISASYKDFVGKSAIVSSIMDAKNGGMVEIDIGSAVIKVEGRIIGYEGPPLRRGERVLITAHVDGDIYECIKA